MALKKVKGTLERVLDKNLQDLVRGIRNHKENEAKYIAECIDEIKQELKQENIAVKANAVSKLSYLQMIGYDISWGAFNIIEVMSSSKFTFKRIGYLSASQSFHDGTDVLMLTTNMIRKDLNSQNMYDAGVALSGLSCFVTQDLARDLANDIMTLMTSTRPYLRKKSVLIMYKVFLQFPEALRPAFPRLKEKLEDPDPGVQSAAVNVICELARKNPKNYLSLAPLFFKLMTSSTNNWVLIKIIKLFSALTPLEPRLGKKLIEPLTNLIHSTSAMSLLYECINTVIAVLISISSGIPNHTASIQLCVQKLRILIEDSDQNLKYLGLLAMSRILQSHPKSVQCHKDLILQCLDDKDESIRLRALDLLYGMVSKKNLMEIVKKLMVHMDKAEGTHYRDELLAKIIEICSQSNYQYVTNFEWYVSVLVELTRMEGTRHGRLIASQMQDVAIRVQAIRSFAVSQMAVLLENSHVLSANSQRNGICEVLYAAAWICGEFAEHLKNPKETLEFMLRPKITSLPGHIQSVYVQNIPKLYARIVKEAEDEDDNDTVKEVTQMMLEKLPMFVQSSDLEVQERACCILQLVKYVVKLMDKDTKVGEEVVALFSGALNPVAERAQKKVPVPEGLDLDKWINRPPAESSDDEPVRASIFTFNHEDHRGEYTSYHNDKKAYVEPTDEELEVRREQRKVEQMHNPHYLKVDSKQKRSDSGNSEDIPLSQIDLSVPLHVPDKYLQLDSSSKPSKKDKKSRRKKKKHQQDESDDDIQPAHEVSTVVDMPEGTVDSDKDDDRPNDQFKKLDMDLDMPLRDDEIIKAPTHRVVLDNQTDHLDEEKPKKKHRKDREERRKHRKEGKEKTSKKKEKKKKEESSLLIAEENENSPEMEVVANGPSNPAAAESAEHQKEKSDKTDDLDFWLSKNDTTPSASKSEKTMENDVRPTPVITVASDDEQETKKPKKKKEKKVKKEKKEKRDKKKLLRADYEVAEGITTPSKEQVSPSQMDTPINVQFPPMSTYQTLGENKSLKLTYEIRGSHQRHDQVVVSVVFTNLTSNQIKDLELNVLDSLNAKLIRGIGCSHRDPVKVPFVLLPNSQNEGQFAFSVDSINIPQKLKGTLTYMEKTDDGSTHEKLDFKINFRCSDFLISTPCKSSEFASLLGSGDLNEKSSISLTPSDQEFPLILAKICFHLHFRVVEQVPDSASLYSKSIRDHPVCLLVKMVKNDIKVDGKGTDSDIVSNILQDIKSVLL
ncbi:AP-3 complex subunit delta [Mytilus galloprovincialis]|uniref:AP-3 complex subunit delta n=1 Tax=Mytilus galloprovincialis TaxID=29158 RepID=A0A8B6GR67_MYTGA|nr:AP-3 complex subunit delta [Mytilus galloprovincialis]